MSINWHFESTRHQGFFQSCGKGCSGFFVGSGWMRKREKRKDKLDREQDEEGREREREIFYIILLCNLYYFNVLYYKIKIGMLRIL